MEIHKIKTVREKTSKVARSQRRKWHIDGSVVESKETKESLGLTPNQGQEIGRHELDGKGLCSKAWLLLFEISLNDRPVINSERF